jgi:hypothetical protein
MRKRLAANDRNKLLEFKSGRLDLNPAWPSTFCATLLRSDRQHRSYLAGFGRSDVDPTEARTSAVLGTHGQRRVRSRHPCWSALEQAERCPSGSGNGDRLQVSRASFPAPRSGGRDVIGQKQSSFWVFRRNSRALTIVGAPLSILARNISLYTAWPVAKASFALSKMAACYRKARGYSNRCGSWQYEGGRTQHNGLSAS